MNGCTASRVRLGGFADASTVDWYGNVSLVVFFAGCNFRCPYCQNSSLLPLDSGNIVDIELLLSRIEMNRSLLDAVVFTGGEPLLQPEPLIEASKTVRKTGLKLMLNTNGSVPNLMEQLLKEELVDRVALDVKAPLTPEDYGKAIGIPSMGEAAAKNVGLTLGLCRTHDVELEVRTTVAPTISEDPDFIRRIAANIKDVCDFYYLQQFDNLGDIISPILKKLSPPSIEAMRKLAEVAIGEGVGNVYIKTREAGLERIG